MSTIQISHNFNISYEQIKSFHINKLNISITNDSLVNCKKCYEYLYRQQKTKIIYGVNTGFGPMARFKTEDSIKLQENLIISHSSGLGKELHPDIVRLVLLSRLNGMIQGKSAVHTDLIELIQIFINEKISPIIYAHGGVGASGDLVQLSHVALALIGKGEVIYNNEKYFNLEIFNKLNIEKLQIKIREGLAIINGVSVMNSLLIYYLFHLENILNLSVLSSCLLAEISKSRLEPFSEELNSVKKHQGQNYIAKKMRSILENSVMLRTSEKKIDEFTDNHEKFQDFYSIRCIPQILGPIYDALENAKNVSINEFNSISDNPIVDFSNDKILNGGNFHGDYISFEADKVKIAFTKLSILIERQINYLFNHSINEALPPFVNLGKLGLNLGMQGAQFVATSNTAELQTISFPHYVHSIPTNNDNQDVVSMGTNSANLLEKTVDNLYEILSIKFLSLVQAVDYLECEQELSPTTKHIYSEIREIVPKFENDIIMYKSLNKIIEYLKNKI